MTEERIEQARATCDAAVAQAWDAYDAAVAQAQDAREAATQQAREAYAAAIKDTQPPTIKERVMTKERIEQMLTNICRCIKNNDDDIVIVGWSVKQDRDHKWAGFVQGLHTAVYLKVKDGAVIAQFTYEDPTPGDLYQMELIPAVHPEGDFQVAATILDHIQ